MGRPNKGSSLTEKSFNEYSASDNLMGFESGGSTFKYNLGNVSKYALEKQSLSAGGKSGTVKSIIDGLTPRIKKAEDDIVELSGDITAKGAALTELSGRVNAMESGPLVAATSSAMVDTTRIYVYTGEELGMTSGDWYYHNGTNWVSGGAYNAVAVNTDNTLSVEDVPADAKAVGDALEEMDEQKANVDGVYESMTVGNAEQLIGSVFTEDSIPYNFRTAGGSIDIGDREIDKLVGGTIAWNQLHHERNGDDKTNIYQGMFGTNNGQFTYKAIIGHVYLTSFTQPAGCAVYRQNRNDFPCGYYVYAAPSQDTRIDFLTKSAAVSSDSDINIALINKSETTEQAYHLSDLQFFDLTQMFGATIADYIYSLEQATAGAGVAWFRKLFPAPYYPYNAGELMSVQTSAHKMRGFNAWDEEWEVGSISNITGQNTMDDSKIRSKNYIPVIPGQKYYVNSPYTLGLRLYDSNKTFIDFGARTNAFYIIPDGGYFMKFVAVDASYYNNDICINLSWDGERDGEYEPYVEHVYPLDSNLTLRGIPKLDASNKLYYDGDTYESDGTVKRKYGIVDLGTLNWTKDEITIDGTAYNYFRCDAISDKANGFDFIVSKYTNVNDARFSLSSDKTASVYNVAALQSVICIRDDSYSSGDAASFKTAMSGVYLVYKRAEPVEETAATYQNPQVVDDFGTEEYVDSRTVAIPVGHETKYANNLRAKLEMAPDSPDGSGDYIVRQSNGQNEYVPLVIPKELPNTPSEDGIYHLKVTVVNGAAGLSWESEA